MRRIFRQTAISAATLAVLCVLTSAGAHAYGCDAFGAKEPILREIVDRVQSLREASIRGDPFAQLVVRAKELAAKAKTALTEAQAVLCGPDEMAMTRFEQCTFPLQWSCESIPPSIDWRFLGATARTEDEKLATVVGHPVLSGPANVFDTCCGDFGCAAGGVGIPPLVYHRESVSRLTRLATFDTDLGRAALATLRKSAEGLETASCSCDTPSPKQMKEFSANLTFATQKTTPDVAAAVEKIQRALAKGLPKAKCKLPGY